jgi:hypothetical protein
LPLLSEAKSLKVAQGTIRLKSTLIRLVLVMARHEAGPCEGRLNSRTTFSSDVQMRVGKQLLAAKKRD